MGVGIFKVRVEITGKPAGKSYGARLIYAIFSVTHEVLLLKIYDKSLVKDLTRAEENALRKMVSEIRKQKKLQNQITPDKKNKATRKKPK